MAQPAIARRPIVSVTSVASLEEHRRVAARVKLDAAALGELDRACSPLTHSSAVGLRIRASKPVEKPCAPPHRLAVGRPRAWGGGFSGAALAQNAICYNCPPEWADWGTQLRKIKEKTGVTVPQDNKNSGQSLAQLVAEKASPVADITYLGVTFGIQAKKEGVVAPYKPAHFDEIPAGLKDPDGNWFTIHSGTLGFMVNVDALKGKPSRSRGRTSQPDLQGMIGYLDPRARSWATWAPSR
jgi:hypothetical protein